MPPTPEGRGTPEGQSAFHNSCLTLQEDIHIFFIALPYWVHTQPQKVMLQCFLGTNPLGGVQLHAPGQKVDRQLLVLVKWLFSIVASGAPQDNLAQTEAGLWNGGDIRLESGAVDLSSELHPPGAKDGGNLNHGLDVVGAVEEGEAAGHDGEEDDAGGPDVELGGLLGALEQDLGGTEATSSCTVGTAGGTGVVLWIAVMRATVGKDGFFDPGTADVHIIMAEAWLGVDTFPLGKAKVDENATTGSGVVEEIGGLDIAVDDVCVVGKLQGGEETAQIDGHVGGVHAAEVVTEIIVAKVGKDGDDLVGAAEGGDEGTHGRAVFEVVEKFQLVEDALRRGCDVDLLDGDVLGSS